MHASVRSAATANQTTTRPPATLSAASQCDDDRDILAGISVMVLAIAIANRQSLTDTRRARHHCYIHALRRHQA